MFHYRSTLTRDSGARGMSSRNPDNSLNAFSHSGQSVIWRTKNIMMSVKILLEIFKKMLRNPRHREKLCKLVP